MSNNNVSSGGGIGFIGGLQLLFIAAKLFGAIEWSWWLVLSPFIISFSFSLLILFFVFLYFIFGKGKL